MNSFLPDSKAGWARLLTQKYLRQTSFVACVARPSDSMIWKAMLKARHTIIDNQRWVIGNGQEVCALDDHWVPNMGILRSQLIADIDTVQAATSTLNMLRLADLLHQSPTGLCWNEGLLCRLWQPHIVQAILLIPLGTRDLRCWKDEPAGTRTFKALCKHFQPRLHGPWPWELVWK